MRRPRDKEMPRTRGMVGRTGDPKARGGQMADKIPWSGSRAGAASGDRVRPVRKIATTAPVWPECEPRILRVLLAAPPGGEARAFLIPYTIFLLVCLVVGTVYLATNLFVFLLYSLVGIPLIFVFEVIAVFDLPLLVAASISWLSLLAFPRLRGLYHWGIGIAVVAALIALVLSGMNRAIQLAVDAAMAEASEAAPPGVDLRRIALATPGGPCGDLCRALLVGGHADAVLVLPDTRHEPLAVEELAGRDAIVWRLAPGSVCEMPDLSTPPGQATEAAIAFFTAQAAQGRCLIREAAPLDSASALLIAYEVGDGSRSRSRSMRAMALAGAAVHGRRADLFVPGPGGWTRAWSTAAVTGHFVRFPIATAAAQGTSLFRDFPRDMRQFGAAGLEPDVASVLSHMVGVDLQAVE